ncbi:CLUMA_CG005161, isoform A [Clunio marinus]|uniref:CLUMA_CG005161, isoform A n=1 Tax=Clunio marinus TaxID=568069 RepID=A0A1J1HY81_9DIPT|nr:CLUMA_CG005161, isoform A [Clunio marinus]
MIVPTQLNLHDKTHIEIFEFLLWASALKLSLPPHLHVIPDLLSVQFLAYQVTKNFKKFQSVSSVF